MHQQNKPSFNKYTKYSSLAFQWIGGFVALSLGGNWLDNYFAFKFPAFTLAGVFVALFLIFYSLYKVVSKPDTDE